MPKYRITGPDGGTYEVSAPEGASESDVMAYAQANYKPKADFSGVTSSVRSTAPSPEQADEDSRIRAGAVSDSSLDNFRAGVGKSLVDSYEGVKMLGTDAARYFVEEGLGMQAPGLRGSLDQQMANTADRRQRDAALMDTKAGFGGNVAGTVAQLVGPGIAARTTAAGAALLPRTIAGNALQGAALGGAQPVSSRDERAGNMALGAVGGAGGAVLGNTIGRAAGRAKDAISEPVRELYDAAKARGITLTPGQFSDSRFLKGTQSMLRSVPFTGAQGRYDAQVGQLNREIAGAIGEKADVVTSNVYALAKARQSRTFDELTSRNALKVDDQLVRSLTNIAESAKMGGNELASQIDAAVDTLYSRATTGPGGVVIPGEAYQMFDSQIGKLMKSGGPSSHYLGNIQKAVRRAMDNSISPADKEAWKRVRTEYGNRKTIAPLVAKAGDGPISPASLQGAVTNNASSKEAMASGTRGELGDLARIGQRMKEPPSSGTAERGAVGAIMGGGAVMDPLTGGLTALALNLVSRGLDSQALSALIMRQNPGMSRRAVAEIVRRSGAAAVVDNPLEIDIRGGRVGAPTSVTELNSLRSRPR